MTPEERAAETFQALLMSGTMMTKLSGDVKLCQIIAQAIREAEAARDERAAKIVEAECDRVLAKQTPDTDPMSINASVNQNLRMMAVMLPEVAAAIRAPDTEG